MLQTLPTVGAFTRRYRLPSLLLVCLLAGGAVLALAGRPTASAHPAVAAHSAHAAVAADSTNSAVTYAEDHWRWTDYNHTTAPACVNSNYTDCTNTTDATVGEFQPDFQCAEFVSRALATEGLLPGLTSSSPQSDYESYQGGDSTYDLLEITDNDGIYNYLVNDGMGTNIGNDNSDGNGTSINYSDVHPGDEVVYTSGVDGTGTREHTDLITSVGSNASKTLVYSHNAAEDGVPLTFFLGGGISGYFILHITVQANACPPSLVEGDSGTWVAILKYALNAYEYNYAFSTSSPDSWAYPLSPSNTTLEANTEAAVVDFQYWGGIGASGGGAVGDRTWAALGFCENYTPPSGPIPDFTGSQSEPTCPSGLGLNDSGDWVEAVQMRLNQAFFYFEYGDSPDNFQPFLSIDGSYGSLTDNAVTDYQVGDGISGGGGGVGNRTWSDLGMCY